MQTYIMGWDIGGAHLKAAVIRPPDQVIGVYQQPCPLWKGLDKLHEAVRAVMNSALLGVIEIDRHILTMTGELADLFAGRDDGIKQILGAMSRHLSGSATGVYAGRQGIIALNKINASHYTDIASANWLASSTWAARKIHNGLFVDIGSTTTDILLLNNSNVMAQGYSDYNRLISKELVYTGIVRTPVMALARTAQDQGCKVGLMAEYFATMADVYRVTGELNDAHDQYETADGAEKTAAASARRLARMIGCDYRDDELPRWRQFAQNLRTQQITWIQEACEKQLQRLELTENLPVIGAGIGRFLASEIAAKLGKPYYDYSSMFCADKNETLLTASDCAPAVAVAFLAK